ncbi:MAG: sigma-70 family RNA polymerase sigma factor [Sedimentisphaerales bacterium]|nr:sigma-70 family RNA polymerase sigma factor [Sedimentisphaerales bacterium]
MDKENQQEVARGLRDGDQQSWLKLYDAYIQKVWQNVARLMGDNSPAIADVVQETFLAAARSAGNYDPSRGSLWNWLWGITRNQVALYYRNRKTKKNLSQARSWWAGLDGEKLDWIDARADTPADILESRELATLIRFTLHELPADYQAVLIAKYLDNEPAPKIAADSGISTEAIRSKLARARKAFRKAFKKLTASTPYGKEVSL